MHAFLRDARFAVRLLVKQPGVTVVALLTLAIGIGGNTAMFSAVDALLLRPLPYHEPDRLVKVWEKRPAEGVLDNVVAPADFIDWARMNTVFEEMAAYVGITADLTGVGEPIRLAAAGVSPPFFDILRVQPALGRAFRREEATPGRHRVVILGHSLWQSRFGGDPAAVGRTISLNGVPHEIVGVLPADFEFPDAAIELWAPMPLTGGTAPPTRSNHSLEVFARMKPGVTLEAARADMDRVGAMLQKEYPDTNRTHGVYVRLLAEDLARPVRSGLLMLLAAVAFVLLIACVNVANLLLARAASRRREMAVRAALGAGRGRLAGQALTESVLLGLAGGAAGLVVAQWAIGLVRRLVPAGLPLLGVQHIGLDGRVLLFTFSISILTGLVFGLLPAWHIAREDVNQSLKDGGRSPGNVRRRLRTGLVVGEIALASLLLVGAGLTLRSFHRLLNTDAGFEIAGRTTALLVLPGRKYADDGKRLAALEEVERRFAAIPGVHAAGATSRLPLGNENSRMGVGIEGREPTPDTPTRAHIRAVTPASSRPWACGSSAGASSARPITRSRRRWQSSIRRWPIATGPARHRSEDACGSAARRNGARSSPWSPTPGTGASTVRSIPRCICRFGSSPGRRCSSSSPRTSRRQPPPRGCARRSARSIRIWRCRACGPWRKWRSARTRPGSRR